MKEILVFNVFRYLSFKLGIQKRLVFGLYEVNRKMIPKDENYRTAIIIFPEEAMNEHVI